MKILKAVAALLLIAFLAACGGGSNGSGTVVSGVASKGPFSAGGTVKIYALVNGAKGTLLAQTSTNADGSYRASLGGYTGPILVEASGSYVDEATGHTVTVSGTAPLRAAIAAAQGSVTLPVTALTELAVRQAGGTLSADAITAANTLLSSIFKVDIVGTLPAAPTATALAAATQAEKDYCLALATVSQLSSGATGSSDEQKLDSALAALAQGISSSGMTSGTALQFEAALNSFIFENAGNQTGITDTSSTSLVNVGTLTKSYTLALQGTVAAGAAHGVQFVITLPQGVTVDANSLDSSVRNSSLALAGNAPSDTMLTGKYTSGSVSVALITIKGIGAGTFATLTCNIPTGTTAPAASDLTVSAVKVIDGQSQEIPAVTVAVN